LLADISEELASQNIIGIPEYKLYTEVFHYWPDPNIYKILQGNWCAAFVYHCCMQAGILLPIRYPNGNYRLAGVGDIFKWAQADNRYFYFSCCNIHGNFMGEVTEKSASFMSKFT